MEFVSGFVVGICFTVSMMILLSNWAKRKNHEANKKLQQALKDIKTRQYIEIQMDIEDAKQRREEEIEKAKNYNSKVIPFKKRDDQE
jgi:hypothetical protein